MTIGVPPETLAKFGLPFTASYRLVVDAVNLIFAFGQLRARSYAVADLPSAAAVSTGSLVFVTDAAGGAVLAFSNGTNWLRCDNSTTVT
jgi:hypothetical protein